MQILGVLIVNTRSVFTCDARQPGDGGAVGVGEFSGLLEAVPARHVLHDALHPLTGELHVPQGGAFEFTEFPGAA
ncbi:hypothetical protein [Deinococcus saxicola]|uniref:hypothetical protein n=1 Tax=Deinococcus saxicola TaxID=249406 RepID=UPI003D137FA3